MDIATSFVLPYAPCGPLVVDETGVWSAGGGCAIHPQG
jgi:hypothetical protein